MKNTTTKRKLTLSTQTIRQLGTIELHIPRGGGGSGDATITTCSLVRCSTRL